MPLRKGSIDLKIVLLHGYHEHIVQFLDHELEQFATYARKLMIKMSTPVFQLRTIGSV
jgi:hypothetical protein